MKTGAQKGSEKKVLKTSNMKEIAELQEEMTIYSMWEEFLF